ncbi:hypothetical protein TEA_002714 [Camellia sinensis var. sinensis]|uniref:SH3 domain-containing protein n=1 Tax=Camellia sinensis var. sinensis TaxID=542762 RepID=A0A4S4D0W0_CAMSN|nr:hypothetical protein TEA_002714 [Camellia sinensis var. sinensis]
MSKILGYRNTQTIGPLNNGLERMRGGMWSYRMARKSPMRLWNSQRKRLPPKKFISLFRVSEYANHRTAQQWIRKDERRYVVLWNDTKISYEIVELPAQETASQKVHIFIQDFQKDIIKAAEAFTAIGYKNIEAGTKLSEDCFRYGVENVDDKSLAKAASLYGDTRKHMEQEQEDINRQLFSQILEPLRAMVTGAPLEDARHLAQRYSRMRQEAETQAAEVSRRHARVREASIPENVAKLHAAESKMHELKANMAVLGKEAATALASVESQQQRLTFQGLVSLVEGEKSYHERIATILGEVEAEMVSEKQRKESAPPVIPSTYSLEKTKYFLAEAMHAFDAASEKELSLAVGDYVVVRKPTGTSEGAQVLVLKDW